VLPCPVVDVADCVVEDVAELTDIGEVDDEFVVFDWLTDFGSGPHLSRLY